MINMIDHNGKSDQLAEQMGDLSRKIENKE
jgi:hypothetical protein